MDLTEAEVSARLAREGLPEMRWLWEARGLSRLDEAEVVRGSDRHMAAARSPWTLLACAAAGWLIGGWGPLAPLAAYAALYLWTALRRLSWRRQASLELAEMLRHRDFRAWHDALPESARVRERLRALGVNERWDDPSYKVVLGAPERPTALTALRQVLGTKEERAFRPGRFFPHLKEGRASVTRFLAAHGEKVTALKEGRLSHGEDARLLRALGDELRPGSAGRRYVDEVVAALESPDRLPHGAVEASIWRRDPWTDLTRASDFFSSASLRGGSWLEALERRTKGALGVFGYLRNKSVSAMDFRTAEGRGARARLAACVAKGAAGRERAVLFVDAVEGRFDVDPAFVRQAVEGYARAAGFESVFYGAMALNAVPRRLLARLAGSGLPLRSLELEYADASRRLYLDAFGLPLEPFEYSYPKGSVVGYEASLRAVVSAPVAPWRAVLRRHRGRAVLYGLTAAALACLAWELVARQVYWPLPAAAVVCALWPRLKRRLSEPSFVERLLDRIGKDGDAVTMSYPPRAAAKARQLLAVFPRPDAGLAPFFEAVLYNASLKDTHLDGALRPLAKLDERGRRKAAALAALLWPGEDAALRAVGLSPDKAARDGALQETLTKLEVLRRFLLCAPTAAWDASVVRSAARALRLRPDDILRLAAHRPKLLRGLWKTPRPVFACLPPLALGAALMVWAPGWAGTWTLTALLAAGTWLISTRLPLAPGVLRYEKTGRRLRQALAGRWEPSAVVGRMRAVGIDPGEYLRAVSYEGPGVRIELRDKRTATGAVEFLASSEEVGNCIALRHFVSWCLPSLLDDETVVLADVQQKSGGRSWRQRAQVWLVAARRGGRPVLVVNSLELNEEGARRVGELLPAVSAMLEDVRRRAGFAEVVVGPREGGEPVEKIHDASLGFAYYFDAFRLRGGRWLHVERRSMAARASALLFGLLDVLKGSRAKGRAQLELALRGRNAWERSLEQPRGAAHAAGVAVLGLDEGGAHAVGEHPAAP